MNAWLTNAVAQAESVNDWLSPLRQTSLQQLQQAPWPNRKVEAWKYTPVKVLEKSTFTAQSADSADNAPYNSVIDGLTSIDIVISNGHCQLPALHQLPQGVSVERLADASSDTKRWAEQTFGKVKPSQHLFGLVNDVLALDGIVVRVAEGVHFDTPIRLINDVSEGVEAHTRCLFDIADNAQLTVIEQFAGSVANFQTSFSEFVIGADAKLEHYRFALQTGESLTVGGDHFQLADRAKLNSTLVGFGSQLSRVDMDVIHAGSFANANVNAIYLLDGKELFDFHSTIEHAQPNGTTEENVRGIVADHAKAVFSGRIHIHRDAQKTLAELNNRNLLLARTAEINTKPELEIYADDVRCAHGATVAELDQSSLYYLLARGISREQAQVMLNFGFINELVDAMPNQVLAEWLRPQLRQRFAQMKVVSD